ncbi:MAG: copper-binding protein [Proteobacteria bacterium]|nr:copper-binding protein [Pseudomonadota bacterium]
MKTLARISFIVLAAAFSVPALAADDHAGHGAMSASATTNAMSDGVVKKVDKTSGKLTIAHGPLENIGMPAMTMAFRVKDAAWLEQIKDGDKIRFVADNVNGNYTVVRFEKAK